MIPNISTAIQTNDAIIRRALKKELADIHAHDRKLRIIEELCIGQGAARIDIAVVNGVLHGYEIKSDRDTLLRLPEQMHIYNAVFEKITLVVGKSHLYDAINIVPDWWGIKIAKIDSNESVVFNVIRETKNNPAQDCKLLATLLWRHEALNILEKTGEARGVRSKSRTDIYERLAQVFDPPTLGEKVREAIFFRKDWRVDAPLALRGD